jgi:alkylmercury lyase
MGGRRFYAWCALDTLFIPGLVGKPAEVSSHCPVSGAEIRLSVALQGVVEYEPSDAVLSVFLPGASGLLTGPASPT